MKFGLMCVALAMSVSAVETASAGPYVIRAGEDWLPLDYRKEIQSGSAVDFSHFKFRDGPAGKYGWLQRQGKHFVFERRPGEPQRFWGANICFEATCPSHADAERIVAFFERAGYNTVRIHHYERTLVRDSEGHASPDPDALERFDYFFAKAKERGIYFTTDLFVSRQIHWRDIGIDREGKVGQSLVKGMFLVHEPAFENWKAFARNFLTHVNPHTGLRYADDPAMPFIVLVNEGAFAWSRGIFDQDACRARWSEWLAAQRANDPTKYPKAPEDCLGCSIEDKELAWKGGLMAFMSDMEARFAIRARDYLRSLGVKALLADWNCPPYVEVDAITNALDYIDMHYYVNHPDFLGKSWSLPARFGNSNPSQATREMGRWCGRVAWRVKRPYTISEWNFTAPNSCRGVAGLLSGASATMLDWSAMWRFDYIREGSDLDDGTTELSYFSILADPFQAASERAGVLLFLRRELAPIKVASESEYRIPIAIESGTGRFTVVSEATAGGFGLAGDTMAAGPLACRLGLSHAAIWASATDMKPLVESDRILLTHLTDLKTEGIRFEDDQCKVLQSWGRSRNLIVRRGTAEVTLALKEPAAYAVWALETNGLRKDRMTAYIKDGKLAFTVDVKNTEGRARYLYEIVREASRGRR